MFKVTKFFEKVFLIVMALGIGLAVTPAANVIAAGSVDKAHPASDFAVNPTRLAKIWERGIVLYDRHGKLLDRANTFISKVENLVSKATARGLDVSAVQTALDDFEAAIRDARPIHQSAFGIINSHMGFNETGQVVDPAQALETVEALGQHLRDFRQAMNGTGMALRNAVKVFLQANRPAKNPIVP